MPTVCGEVVIYPNKIKIPSYDFGIKYKQLIDNH